MKAGEEKITFLGGVVCSGGASEISVTAASLVAVHLKDCNVRPPRVSAEILRTEIDGARLQPNMCDEGLIRYGLVRKAFAGCRKSSHTATRVGRGFIEALSDSGATLLCIDGPASVFYYAASCRN